MNLIPEGGGGREGGREGGRRGRTKIKKGEVERERCLTVRKSEKSDQLQHHERTEQLSQHWESGAQRQIQNTKFIKPVNHKGKKSIKKIDPLPKEYDGDVQDELGSSQEGLFGMEDESIRYYMQTCLHHVYGHKTYDYVLLRGRGRVGVEGVWCEGAGRGGWE